MRQIYLTIGDEESYILETLGSHINRCNGVYGEDTPGCIAVGLAFVTAMYVENLRHKANPIIEKMIGVRT